MFKKTDRCISRRARVLLLNLIKSIKSGNIAAACAQLTGVINVIQTQVGTGLTQSEATALIRLATDAKRMLRCQWQDDTACTKPVGEMDVGVG